jgi:hypothetical protein
MTRTAALGMGEWANQNEVQVLLKEAFKGE